MHCVILNFVLMNLVEFVSWHTFRSKLYYFPVVFEIAVLISNQETTVQSIYSYPCGSFLYINYE